MWLILAFISAALLGFYDVFKKKSLKGNAVIPVLMLNTLFSSLILFPIVILSHQGNISSDSLFYAEEYGWKEHQYIIVKSCIVLASWTFGYFGIKNIPLTIAGPINATRPIWVLIGSITFFGERLNMWQWAGVIVAILGLYMISRSSKKEGIDFRHNLWIVLIILSNILGAISGLYDKFLMASTENGGVGLDNVTVQAWYNVYQLGLMLIIFFVLWRPNKHHSVPFHWDWSIIFISVFLVAADFLYFLALGQDGAMISIVSMVRRGSVIVSFIFGAMVFREKNLGTKVIDLVLVLLSMFLLYIGSR